MKSIIQDIITDPSEYLPTLIFISVFFLVWAGLFCSGYAAIRARTRRRRFWFSFAPLIFGLIGVKAQMPVSMQSGDGKFHWSFDFRWFFVVPLCLGIAGLISWWRLRRDAVA